MGGAGIDDIISTLARLMREHPGYDIELVREDFGQPHYVHAGVIYIHAGGLPSPIGDILSDALRQLDKQPPRPQLRPDGRPRLVAIDGGGGRTCEPLRATSRTR